MTWLSLNNNLNLWVLVWKYTQVSRILSIDMKRDQNISFFKQLDRPMCKTSTFIRPRVNESIHELKRKWISKFEANSVPEPEASIRHIIEHVLNITKSYEYELNQNKKVTEEQEKLISDLCECRLARMPVQYIIKEWDFRDLTLKMCPPVFIPRPETEQLVDLVLDRVTSKSTILEVGCGSGAISLSILKALPSCRVVAVDQSRMACQLTSENAQLNGLTSNLQVVHAKLQEDGTLSASLPPDLGVFDVIVSNPPYVPYAHMADLQPEIKLYEDLRALEAGRDGLRVIKALLLFAPKVLKPGGPIFLEVDTSHPTLIKKWLSDHPETNVQFVKSFKDYSDRDRFVELMRL